MLDRKLKTIGTITMSELGFDIEDFDADGASCREVAALAILWAIGELQNELASIVDRPGGNGRHTVS